MTMYNVGEHVFTGKKVNNPFNYDDSYDLWVDDRDTLVKQSAKKGVPYEKYMTACLSAFIEPGATVLDIGANVGTVSLPLSRLHGGNVHVVSFEPFPNTYSILFKNVTQNNAFNVVPLKMAVGDRNRKEISLSDNLVIPPDFKDKKGKSTTIDLKKDNDTIHFGAIHVGVGETKTSMATVDELKLNISAMKVDVEGAEPLVFYGAKKTIKRCMPVIVFEHNENIVSDEMKKALNLTAAVATFDILQYCYSLGYRLIYELHIQDYMLVPPGRKQLVLNSIAKFKKVKNIKTFNPALINKFSLYKFITPRW
jgi:FkbM family methyltransferase